MNEAIEIEVGKEGKTYLLGHVAGELIVVRTSNDGRAALGRYTDDGIERVGLTAEMTQALCHLLGDDRESQTIGRLRADHDALNARYAESGRILDAYREQAVNDAYERDILTVRIAQLEIQIREHDEMVYQANSRCGKAVNRAEILEKHARNLLDAVTAWSDTVTKDQIPSDLAKTWDRLQKQLGDPSATREIAAVASDEASDED